MCRLLLTNKLGVQHIKEKYGLKELFNHLEKSSGGFGNGFALVKDKKVVFLKKGVYLTNDEIAKIVDKMDYDWLLYHTRIASMGSVCDANCHPFRQGNLVLAMNGTETDFKGVANLFNTTDTEAIAKIITRFRLPIRKVLTKLTGTYVGFINGVAFAVSNSEGYKNLEIVKNDDGALIFASELPAVFERKEAVKLPFFFAEPLEMPDIKEYKGYSKTWKNISDGGHSEKKYSYLDGWYDKFEEEKKADSKKTNYKNVNDKEKLPELTPDSLDEGKVDIVKIIK